MENENIHIPDAPTARPYCHTHPWVDMEPKHKTRASVRLTEQAHLLLVKIAEKNDVSMKHAGSEAIFSLERAPLAEKMYREHITQLKFKALKSKQLAVIFSSIMSISMLLLGVILGVLV